MCPISIYPFEDSFDTLYNYYQNIVEENAEFLATTTATEEQLEDLNYARDISEAQFDPLFGLRMNTKSGELIPYYRNYTVKSTGPYVEPDMEVPNYARVPRNIANWNTAEAGMTILVLADEALDGAIQLLPSILTPEISSMMKVLRTSLMILSTMA